MGSLFSKVWRYLLILPICVVCMRGFLLADASSTPKSDEPQMKVCSYISDPAQAVLKSHGITEAEIESFTRDGIKSRSLSAMDDGRVYEGSRDCLRIDIRKKKMGLLLELSVRQGASINNMLERWRDTLLISTDASSTKIRKDLFGSIVDLLNRLKSKYGSPEYKRGEMIPEDYQAERDE